MAILGIGKIDLTDLADAIISGSQPSSTAEGQLWIDTSDPKNPPVLKVYTNGKWVTQSLDVKKLDEGLAKEITKITETLGSMVNDNKLDINERITLVRELSKIIGAVPSTSTEVLADYARSLPTGEALDRLKKGEYARLRIAAIKLGIDPNSPEMSAYTAAYNSLVDTLKQFGENSGGVYPWDITNLHKDKVVNVDADTFRQKWVDYYNAQNQIQTAILSIPGPAGVSPANISLSNENITIPTDDKGKNAIFDQAFTHLKLYIGGTDTTNEWTIRHQKLSGELTYTYTNDSTLGPKFTVTAINSDVASIEVTASKEGYSDLKRIINVSKVKTGERAVLEYLEVSSTVLVKDVLGNILPGEIEIKGLKKEGNLQPDTDNYIYEVYTSTTNETEYKKVYTSPDSGEEKHVFNLTLVKNNLKLVKASMLNAKTKKVIDSQTIVVVSDGLNGTSPLFVDLSNDSVVINTDSSGNALAGSYTDANTEVRVFLGSVEMTNSSDVTIEFSPSTGVEINNTRNKANVVNMAGNTGKVTVTVTYKGNRVKKEFTLSKNRNGVEGQPAINRRINGPSVINLNDNITSYAYSLLQKIGTGAETAATDITFKFYNNKKLWKTLSGSNVTLTKEEVKNLNDTTPIREGITLEAYSGNVLADREIITVVKDGDDGTSITSTVTEYILTDNPTKPTSDNPNWSTTSPSISSKIGKFTWMRTKVTYSDNNVETSEPVAISNPNQVLKVRYANLNNTIIGTRTDKRIDFPVMDIYFQDKPGKTVEVGQVYTVVHEIRVPSNVNRANDYGVIPNAAKINRDGGKATLYYEKIGEDSGDIIYRVWYSGVAKTNRVVFDSFNNFMTNGASGTFALNTDGKLLKGYLYDELSDSPAGKEYRGEILVTEGSTENDLTKYSWYKIVGREGQSAVSYNLELNYDSVRKTITGVYEPGVVEIKLRKIIGEKSSLVDKRNIKIKIVDSAGNKTDFTPTNTTERERALIDLNSLGKDVDRIEVNGIVITDSVETVVHSRTITIVKDPSLQSLDPFLNIIAREGNIYSIGDNSAVTPSENIIKSETRNLSQAKYTWYLNDNKVKSSSDIPAYEKVTKSDYVAGDIKADTGEIIPSGESNSTIWVSSTYIHKRADSSNFIVIGGLPSSVTCKVYQFDSKGKYLGVSNILSVPGNTVKELNRDTRQLAVTFKTVSPINVGTLESYNIRLIYSNNSAHATQNLDSTRDNLPFDSFKVTSADMRGRDSVKVKLEVEGVNNGKVITLSDTIVLNKVSRENVKTYTWKVYADDADGTTGFSTTIKNSSKYIGFAFNKPTDTVSMNKTDYIWVPNTALVKDIDDKIDSVKDLEDKGSQNIFSMYDLVNFKLNNDDFNRKTFSRKNLDGNPFNGNEYPMYIRVDSEGDYYPLNGNDFSIKIEPDKYYTFSMWVYLKRSSGNDYLTNTNFIKATGWSGSIGLSPRSNLTTLKKTDKNNDFKFTNETDETYSIRSNKWVRVAFNFKTSATDNNIFRPFLRLDRAVTNFTRDIYIAGIQLEEGRNLSNYSKSVKDIIHGNTLRNYVLRSSDIKLSSSRNTTLDGDYLSDDFLNDGNEIYSLGYDVELVDFKGRLNGFAIGVGPRDSSTVFSPVINMDKYFKDIDYSRIPNGLNTKFRVYGSFSQSDFRNYVLKVIRNTNSISNGEIIISNITINRGPVLGQYTYANEDQSAFFNDSLLDNLVVTDNFLNLEKFRLSDPMLVEPVSNASLFGEYNAIKVKSNINRNMLLDTNVGSFSKKVSRYDRYYSDANLNNIMPDPTFKPITRNDRPVNNVDFMMESINKTADYSNATQGRQMAWYSNGIGVGLEHGKTYTASFYARKAQNNPNLVVRTMYGAEGLTSAQWYDDIVSEDWTRISRTFTVNQPRNSEKLRLWLGGIGRKYAGTLQTTGFKLEEGNTATPYIEGSKSFTIEIDELSPNTDYYVSLEARNSVNNNLNVSFPVRIRDKHSKDIQFYDAFVDNGQDFSLDGTINGSSSTLIGRKFNTGRNGKSITITFPNISQSDYYIYKIQVKKSNHYIPYTPSSKDLNQASYTTTLTQDTFTFNADSQGKVIGGPTFPNNVCDFSLYSNGKKTRNFNLTVVDVSSREAVREGYIYDVDNESKSLRANAFPKNVDYAWIKVGIIYAGNLVDVKKVVFSKTVPGNEYTWTAYADDVDKVTLNVKGFSFNSEGKAWIGIARHMPTSTPSDDYNIYDWYTINEEKTLAETSVEDRDSGEGRDYVFTPRGQEGGIAQLTEIEGLGHEFIRPVDEVVENYIYESSFKRIEMSDIALRETEGEFGKWFIYEKVGTPSVSYGEQGLTLDTTRGFSFVKLRCPIYRLPDNRSEVPLYLRIIGNGGQFNKPYDHDNFNTVSLNLVINHPVRDYSYNIPDGNLRVEYSMSNANYNDNNYFSSNLNRTLKVYSGNTRITSGYTVRDFYRDNVNTGSDNDDYYRITTRSASSNEVIESIASSSRKSGKPYETFVAVEYQGKRAFGVAGKYKASHNNTADERFVTKIPFLGGFKNMQAKIPGSVGKMYLEICVYPNRQFNISDIAMGEVEFTGGDWRDIHSSNPPIPSIGYVKPMVGVKDFDIYNHRYQENMIKESGDLKQRFYFNKYLNFDNPNDEYSMMISYDGYLNNLYSINKGYLEGFYNPDWKAGKLSVDSGNIDVSLKDPWHNPKYNLQYGGDFSEEDGGFYKGWAFDGGDGVTRSRNNSSGLLRLTMNSGSTIRILTRGRGITVVPNTDYTMVIRYNHISGSVNASGYLWVDGSNNRPFNLNDRNSNRIIVRMRTNGSVNGDSANIDFSVRATGNSVFELGKIMLLKGNIPDRDIPDFIGTQGEETGIERVMWRKNTFNTSNVGAISNGKYLRLLTGGEYTRSKLLQFVTNGNYHNNSSGRMNSSFWFVTQGGLGVKIVKNMRNPDESYIPVSEYNNPRNFRTKKVVLSKPLYRVGNESDKLYLNEDDGKYYVTEKIGVLKPTITQDMFRLVNGLWEVTVNIPDLKWSLPNINHEVITSNFFNTEAKGNRSYMKVDKTTKNVTFVIPSLDIIYDPRKGDKKLIKEESPYGLFKYLESVGRGFTVYYIKDTPSTYDLTNNRSASIALNSLNTFEGNNYFYTSIFYPTKMKVKFRSKNKALGSNIALQLGEISEKTDTFEKNVVESLMDNIVTEREKAGIDNSRKLLENENANLMAQYSSIPLDVKNRSALDNAKNVYTNRFDELIKKIDSAIDDSGSEKASVNKQKTIDELSAGFNSYRLDLRNFVLEMQKALYAKVDSVIADIESKNYVKSSEFEKLDTAFKFRIDKAGGMNMLKNSTGYIWSTNPSDATGNMWLITGSTQLTDISSDLAPIYNSLGTGCGFRIVAPRDRDVIMYQSIATSPGRYSLDLFFRNDHSSGGSEPSFTVKVINGSISSLNDNSKRVFLLESNSRTIASSSTDLENFRYTRYINGFEHVNPDESERKNPFAITESFSAANPYNLTVAIIVKRGNTATVSGVMLKGGETSAWTPHPSENYSGNVTMDSTGLTVRSSSSKNYTVMNTQEFAGYYVGGDGRPEKIFTLSGEETQVKNLYVKGSYLRLGNLRLETVNDDNGWIIYKV